MVRYANNIFFSRPWLYICRPDLYWYNSTLLLIAMRFEYHFVAPGTFDAPIYFIFESEYVNAMLADMVSADSSDVRLVLRVCPVIVMILGSKRTNTMFAWLYGQAYQLSVSVPEPKPKRNITLTNIQVSDVWLTH